MILVTGGAGYIGSHVVRELQRQRLQAVVLDNLTTGHREALSGCEFVVGDISKRECLKEVFARYPIDAIMHFSALSLVEESMRIPVRYYRDNVWATLILLEEALKAKVEYFIFSSTAAVYGTPSERSISEAHPTVPINPYGHTKLAIEWMLRDFERAYGLKYSILRYFNAAGADPQGDIGEDHRPESHLIPRVLQSAMEGQAIPVYGTDYDTSDGTCIRDFIHVNDLAAAHILALHNIRATGRSTLYNIGTGKGASVREVIEAARRVTGIKITVKEEKRRPGDPPVLVAGSHKVAGELGWAPAFSLEQIIETAWKWHKGHPQGYGAHQ